MATKKGEESKEERKEEFGSKMYYESVKTLRRVKCEGSSVGSSDMALWHLSFHPSRSLLK